MTDRDFALILGLGVGVLLIALGAIILAVAA